MTSTGFSETSPAPAYYSIGIEPIKYICSHNLNFNLGNVVKYVSRAGLKDGENAISDLLKAKDYLIYEMERIREK